jgi:hypothetical protein
MKFNLHLLKIFTEIVYRFHLEKLMKPYQPQLEDLKRIKLLLNAVLPKLNLNTC